MFFPSRMLEVAAYGNLQCKVHPFHVQSGDFSYRFFQNQYGYGFKKRLPKGPHNS